MKKIFVGLIAVLAFLLSACGGDGGELAGKWKGDKEGKVWVIKYNKDENDYTQVFMDKGNNGEELEGTVNSHLKRNGNWLGDQDDAPGHEKYFIKVIDKNTLQFRDDENDIYRRVQ